MRGETLPDRFAEHLRGSRFLDGATRVVVALSGGGDSTALLVLLHPFARAAGIEVVPAHVAHSLRGEAGERDARFAADLAASLGLFLELRPVPVPDLRKKGESLEAAARRLRYETLLSLRDRLGETTLVATGHTLDDQAETVLLNLARHAGRTRGGIRPRRADGVVRPLLPFTREELRAFLRETGLGWREDETNDDERLLRNRIRRRVLPELERSSPGAASRLARAAEAWTRRLDALDATLDAALADAAIPPGGPFPRSLLVTVGRDAAGRLLQRAASLAGGVPGRAQLERVLGRLSRGDPEFGEALAGGRLEADPRTIRLRPARKAPPDRLGP